MVKTPILNLGTFLELKLLAFDAEMGDNFSRGTIKLFCVGLLWLVSSKFSMPPKRTKPDIYDTFLVLVTLSKPFV